MSPWSSSSRSDHSASASKRCSYASSATPEKNAAWRRRTLFGCRRADELLRRVLADRLEHQEALVRPIAFSRLDSTSVLDRVEIRAGDYLRGREREPAARDTEAGERAPCLVRAGRSSIRWSHEASVGAPVRRARRSAAADRSEPLEAAPGREQPRPRRRQLDRQRQTVEPAADLADGCVPARQLPARHCAPPAGRRASQRRSPGVARSRYSLLRRHAQRRSGSSRGRERRPDAASSAPRPPGAAVDDVLEVVQEDEELPPSAEEAGEVVRRPHRARDLGGHGLWSSARRAGSRRRRRAPDVFAATWSASRVFPVPPGPVTVRSRVPFESSATSSSTSRSRHERHRDAGQVRCIERPQRRELAVPELEEPLGLDEVL